MDDSRTASAVRLSNHIIESTEAMGSVHLGFEGASFHGDLQVCVILGYCCGAAFQDVPSLAVQMIT